METKPFNSDAYGAPLQPSTPGRPNPAQKKKNSGGAAGMAASAAVGAAAGFAAGQFAAGAVEPDIEPEPIPEPEPEPQPAPQPHPQPAPQPAGGSHQQPQDIAQNPQAQQPIDQPNNDDYIADNGGAQQPVNSNGGYQQPIGGNGSEHDDDIVITPEGPIGGEDIVNPDDVAGAVLAEEMIDPNDLESAEVFDFTEIGTVTTIEGDEMTVAYFQNGGETYAMIDVNNDGAMDVITDEYGNMVSSDAYGYTTDDIIDRLTAGDTYLAATDDFDTSLDGQMESDMIC